MTTSFIINSDPNTTLSNLHLLLISYHSEIANRLPNPPSKHYLSQMSIIDLFSSLQLSIYMATEMQLKKIQSQYEAQLQNYENQLRFFSRIRCLSKIQKEAMENKLKELLSKEDEFDKIKRQVNKQLNLKENELLIIRAENSNLKKKINQLEEDLASSTLSIESLNKKLSEYNTSTDNSKSNINININDISNSHLIINDRFTSPGKKIIKKDNGLSTSHSNRNMLFGMYRELFSPNKSPMNGNLPPKMLFDQFNYNTITNEKGSNMQNINHKKKDEKLIAKKNRRNNSIAKGEFKNQYRKKFIANAQLCNSQQNSYGNNTFRRDIIKHNSQPAGNDSLKEYRNKTHK